MLTGGKKEHWRVHEAHLTQRRWAFGLTFSRIDIDPWLVEHLLILPVPVPQDRFDAEKQNQDGGAVHQNGPGGPAAQPDVQRPHPHGDQQAEAHAGDVEHPLSDHKPHVEKEVCGGEEGDGQQAQGEGHHLLAGGQRSPALKVLFGSIVWTINIRVYVEIVGLFVTVPMVTVPVTASVPAVGVMVGFTVDVLQLRSLLPPQAEASQRQQSKVEGGRVAVPAVGDGPDQRQRVHRPIKAQRVRAEEQPEVDGRQVEEG